MNVTNKPFRVTWVFIGFILLSISIFLHSHARAETIEVGILMTAGPQKASYLKHAKSFEAANPGVNVKVNFFSDTEFKEKLPQWLAQKNGPQIVSWQGGRRLFQYAEKGLVTDLTPIWKKYNLASVFTSSSVNAVTKDAKHYAVPTSYYQWGFYYRASLFSSLDITPPNTWQEFLQVCETLKRAGIVPITIGAKNKWTSAAWFDYLNLRINGLDFHIRLLNGEESFASPKVKKVLTLWQTMLNNGYFTNRFNGWSWQQAMPFSYHKMAGMTLIGNFFAGAIPSALKADYRFFAFPTIDPNIPNYEEAPLDLFMVPSYADINPSMEKFLVSLSQVKFQQDYNDKASTISPNINTPTSTNYFIKEGQKLLSRAKGVSQFFDRDTNAGMASAATVIFTDFMGHKNVEKAMQDLESARQVHLQ